MITPVHIGLSFTFTRNYKNEDIFLCDNRWLWGPNSEIL